ncbi:hypothetical protein B0H19DRAFT_1382604 [Mycena capillaripes]|nr:hypothetical protein B0H19DRAFT_1382604 [Mycena capillaripes]
MLISMQDDGLYIYLRNISDQFTAAGAKATFFMNGNNWDCIYNADRISDVKYAYAAGHVIGSHTWAHSDLTTFSSAQIEDGMYRMEEAFSRILGIKPAFMRPPYGNYNSNIQSITAGRGQSLALSKPKNALILEHETEETTATKLAPYAIKLFQGLGYNVSPRKSVLLIFQISQLVTMADCLGVDPYQAIGAAQGQTVSLSYLFRVILRTTTPSRKTGGAQGMTVPVGGLVGVVGSMMLL